MASSRSTALTAADRPGWFVVGRMYAGMYNKKHKHKHFYTKAFIKKRDSLVGVYGQ